MLSNSNGVDFSKLTGQADFAFAQGVRQAGTLAADWCTWLLGNKLQ